MTIDTYSPRSDQWPPPDDPNISERVAIALADQIECALLACDAGGRLLHANRAGQAVIANGNLLTLVSDRVLRASTSPGDWSSAVHDAAVHRRCRLFWTGNPCDRTMVIAMPIIMNRLRIPTAVMMLGRRSVCSNLGLELLATQHALTFAERRVLHALLNDTSPRKIATLHGVTITTIRTQIQSVRDKLGVRSIDALLRRAAEVPPITSWH